MRTLNLPPNWTSWDELLQCEAGQDYLVASPNALNMVCFLNEPVKTLPLVRPDEIPTQPLDEFGLPEVGQDGEFFPNNLYLAEIYQDGSAWLTFLETELVVKDWQSWCNAEGRDPNRPWRGLER